MAPGAFMAATIDLLMETARQLTVAQQREAIYRLAKEVMTRTGDHSLHVAGPSAGEDDLYVIPTPAHEFKIRNHLESCRCYGKTIRSAERFLSRFQR